MPQKRNPDAWELLRGEAHRLAGYAQDLRSLAANLSAGYWRDAQRSKELLFAALDHAAQLWAWAHAALQGISFRAEACQAALHPSLFATQAANALVAEGIPFREAYRQAAANPPKEAPADPGAGFQYEGAPGKAALGPLQEAWGQAMKWEQGETRRWQAALASLQA